MPPLTPPQNTTSNFIDSLTVTAVLTNESWAGTDDNIYISMGGLDQMQLLCEAPRAGQSITIDIDINKMFGRPLIALADITGIRLSQSPDTEITATYALNAVIFNPLTARVLKADAWKLESLLITANGIYTNTTFASINQWLGYVYRHISQVWSGTVAFEKWKNSEHRSIDFNAQTYPIRWMPFIGDLLHWRCYDPSKISGVGQLIGMSNGKLIGTQLKQDQSEELAPNSETNSYTWVYTPEGAIIYKRWEHRTPSNYIRHSQLGSGRPVACAGEFRIIEHRMDSVIALVNDASGHYKPDGGACLRYVAEKFEALGINTEHTEWKWKIDAQ